MKFHWSLLDDQHRCGSSFFQLSCVTSYFALIWQLLMYFCVEEYGIYFYYLLSVCCYKDRCVCICVQTHTGRDVCRHSHCTQTNVVGKPLPLFPIINYALVHCRLQLTWMGRAWRFGLLCPNLFPCIKKLQNLPKPHQAALPNLEALGSTAAPSRNNSGSPHGEIRSPQFPWIKHLFHLM